MLQYFAESRWYTIVGATAFYAVTSYWLLYAADEHDLITNADFIYWLAVTASTVGYGDMFPISNLEKVVAVFCMMVGVAVFSVIME